MSFHKAPFANLALVTLASLTGAVHANFEEDVSAAFDILNTFDPDNAEPFCAGFINHEQPLPSSWVSDEPTTITVTTPCDSTKPGYETGVTTTPTPTGYPAYSPVYPVNSTGSVSYGNGYASSLPGYGGNSQEVITILTTTTITYTVTSTVYAPAATTWPAYPTLAKRDIFCDDYGVPCRLVQYSPEVIADACAKYLDQTGIITAIAEHDSAPTATAAATVTVTAAACGHDAEHEKPEEYPGHEEEHHDEPTEEYPGHEEEPADEDNQDDAEGDYEGDGEDAPDSSNEDDAVGDGEDAPDAPYDDDAAGDGEDTPDALVDNYGDGEDVPDAPYDSAGDGEDTPDPLLHEGEGDGTGFSPYA